MRYFERVAKAKAAIEKRKAQELAANTPESDNADSDYLGDPWGRPRQYSKLESVKSNTASKLCTHCAWRPPKPSMLHGHHITPRACGGSDDPENIIVLCPNCHALAHYVTAMSRLQRRYTGPSTARELRRWMDAAYKPHELKILQRDHLIACVTPIISQLRV